MNLALPSSSIPTWRSAGLRSVTRAAGWSRFGLGMTQLAVGPCTTKNSCLKMGGVSHRWFLSFKVIIFTLDVWQDILRKTDPGFSLCTFSLGLAGTVLVTLVLTLSSSSPVNDCQLRPRWGVECWLAPGPGQRAAGWPCQRVSLHLRSFLKICD